MGRAPCCDKAKVKKGPWSPEEDAQLKHYIQEHGTGGNWIALPHKAGLKRCGKSCRLRWLNYLRPNIKHGDFSEEEDRIICTLFTNIGSRWSIIAAQLPGRTDNDIKNYWNTKLKKKLMSVANNPQMSHHKITTSTAYHHLHPTLLLNSPSPQSPRLSLPYTNGANYYSAPSPTLSFTGFDHSNPLCYSDQNEQQEDYLSPPSIQSSYPVFGGAPEPCSTSSDGSSKRYDHQQQGANLQEYSHFNVGSSMEEEDQKMVFQTRDSLIWDEHAPTMDYGFEEIKQLISSNSSTTTFTSPSNYSDFNNCNGPYTDETRQVKDPCCTVDVDWVKSSTFWHFPLMEDLSALS